MAIFAITKEDEKLISQVEKGEGAKHGRDARKYAVDCWQIHKGALPKPKDWKDPYTALEKAAKAKAKPKTVKAKAKK